MPQDNKAPTRLQGVGLSGLAGVQRGLSADLFGLPVDTVANVADLGLAGYGTAAGFLGRQDLAPDLLDRSRVVGSGDWIAGQLSRTGALMGPVESESGAGRAAFAFGRGGAGAAFGLRTSPILAAETGVRGGVASMVTEEVGEITGNPVLAASAAFVAGHGRPAARKKLQPSQGVLEEAPHLARSSGKTEWHKIIADALARVMPEARTAQQPFTTRDGSHDIGISRKSRVDSVTPVTNSRSEDQDATDSRSTTSGAGVNSELPSAGTARHVNPKKSMNNCANCTFVVNSLLKSGARSSALPRDEGVPFSELEGFFGTKLSGWTTRKALEAELMRSPQGTVAVIYGMNRNGSKGHVWNAVVQRGRINYIDGQTGSGGEVNFQNFPSIQFGIVE